MEWPGVLWLFQNTEVKTHFKLTYKISKHFHFPDSTVERVRRSIKIGIENRIRRHLCQGKYITNIVSLSILKLIENSK